jgi:hypothetical protein
MRLAQVALVSVALCLQGCIEYEERLTLAGDGSGNMQMDIRIDLAFLDKLNKLDPGADAGEDSENDLKGLFSKEAILKGCNATGIKIKTCDVKEAGTKTAIKLDFDFANLDALRSIGGFSDRELEFTEANGNVEATYKFLPKLLVELGLVPPETPPTDEKEKKACAIVNEARKDASVKFTLKLPGKLVTTNGAADPGNDKAATWSINKKDQKALDALTKEPLVMKAAVAKKDAPFFEKEKARKKAEEGESEPPKKAPEK